MPHPLLTLKNHLSSAELKQRYLSCKQGIERTRWHLLWLIDQGDGLLTTAQAAQIVGRTPDWARKTIRRYNKEGVARMVDQRQKNGNQKLLNQRQQQSLRRVLAQRPADGGLWTGPKVAKWISQQAKQRISPVTGWHYLKFLNFSIQVPRPHHCQSATLIEQNAFKKTPKKGRTAKKQASSQKD